MVFEGGIGANVLRAGGIVLCGGQSSRMGRPKAWLPIAGEPMLCRIVRILRGCVSPVVIVAAPGQDLPPLPSDTSIAFDETPGHGPLQGMLAGLEMIASRADHVYLTGCDTPLLKPEFVMALLARLKTHAAVVPTKGNRIYPLPAAYHVAEVLPAVKMSLDANRFAIHHLFDSLSVCRLAEDEIRAIDPQFDSLRDADTPGDYHELLNLISGASE